MARRTTPRSPKEALEISRALRNKFISPEAQETAKRLFSQQAEIPPEPTEKPFSDSERRRAAAILSDIRKKYPPKH